MKKLLVLLLALTFVSAWVSAQDAEAAPVPEAKLVAALSGDATVKFGIDLDSKASGILNATSSNLTLQLVTKASTEKGGKEGETVYGWIKLKDFEIKIDGTLSVAKPGIEAKLFLGPVYINILGDGHGTAKADLTMDIGITQKDNGDATWDVLGLTKATAAAGDDVLANEHKGLYIGLTDTSIVDVKIGVQSYRDWVNDNKAATYKLDTASATPAVVVDAAAVTDKGDNLNNIYDTWLSVDLNAVPGLIFGVKAALSLNDPQGTFYGVGTKVGYKITLADNIVLTPEVGFDYRNDSNDVTGSAWEFTGGVGLTLPGSKLDDWDKFGSKKDILPGLSVLFTTGAVRTATATSDLQIAFFDADLIPVVNLVAVGEIYNLSATANVGLGVFANADFGVVVPYATFRSWVAPSPVAKTFLTVGVDLKVITNTTFTLEYASKDLTLSSNNLGVITFACKIAY